MDCAAVMGLIIGIVASATGEALSDQALASLYAGAATSWARNHLQANRSLAFCFEIRI
jgi:hypothetical protein